MAKKTNSTKEEATQQEGTKRNFKNIDIHIPFQDFNKEPIFVGVLKCVETIKEENGTEREIIMAVDEEGNKLKLGASQIISFWNNFYKDEYIGKTCMISFTGKEQITGGRSVNNFDFQVES